MHYCIVHFLTMLRKEQSKGFCREPRVEGKMLRGEGLKYANDLYIKLFIISYISLSARGL